MQKAKYIFSCLLFKDLYRKHCFLKPLYYVICAVFSIANKIFSLFKYSSFLFQQNVLIQQLRLIWHGWQKAKSAQEKAELRKEKCL